MDFGERSSHLKRLLSYYTDVREPRTATGSRMFPFLARLTGKALVGRLWLDVTNVMASKRSKKGKNSTSGCRPWLTNICAQAPYYQVLRHASKARLD